jgi:hypothetical protein
MVRVTMPSAQNNTLLKDRLISARVSDSPVERSRFGLVKRRILVIPWWTDQHHNQHVKAIRSSRDSSRALSESKLLGCNFSVSGCSISVS